MANETESPAPATEEAAGVALIGFCPDCDAAFLVHEGRPWSPCHGVEPVVKVDLNAILDGINVLTEAVMPIMQYGVPKLLALAAELDEARSAGDTEQGARDLGTPAEAEAPAQESAVSEGEAPAAAPALGPVAETPDTGASPLNEYGEPLAAPVPED